LSQIGIEDSESLLSQLSAELTNEQLQDMITDPETYIGLSQLATEYNSAKDYADNNLAQIAEEYDTDYATIFS